MKWSRVLAGVAAASTLAFGATAQAAVTLGADFSGAFNMNTSVWDLGYEFLANRDVDVVGLGFWDDGSATQDQQVGLWNVYGKLITSVFVPTSAASVGDGGGDGWKFVSITPYELTAGDTYYVSSQGGADWAYGVNGFTTSPDITYVQDVFAYTGAQNDPLQFPGSSNNNDYGIGNFGGNVELASVVSGVPEPAAWAMLMLGLFGVGAAIRAKRSSAGVASLAEAAPRV